MSDSKRTVKPSAASRAKSKLRSSLARLVRAQDHRVINRAVIDLTLQSSITNLAHAQDQRVINRAAAELDHHARDPIVDLTTDAVPEEDNEDVKTSTPVNVI